MEFLASNYLPYEVLFSNQPNMGSEKSAFDLIVDNDNNERLIAIEDFNTPIPEADFIPPTPSATDEEEEEEHELGDDSLHLSADDTIVEIDDNDKIEERATTSRALRDHLEPYAGLIEYEVDQIKNIISIREAAIAAAGRSKKITDIEIKCDCTGKCQDRRCNCFKADLKCNSHCHLKKSASNKCCENIESKKTKKK